MQIITDLDQRTPNHSIGPTGRVRWDGSLACGHTALVKRNVGGIIEGRTRIPAVSRTATLNI